MYGGSCLHPNPQATVCIVFDTLLQRKTFLGKEIVFSIENNRAPKSAYKFKQLIAWSCTQLKQGAVIHAGCIGGHGRTGTYLAALVTALTGELDSINYVRKHYCSKAVESTEQVQFLAKNFGIVAVIPANIQKQFNFII